MKQTITDRKESFSMSVAIEIDGKQLQVEEGMNLLEAAL